MAGFVCVREVFLEEKVSKMGTEELVTVLVGFFATSPRSLILTGLEYFE